MGFASNVNVVADNMDNIEYINTNMEHVSTIFSNMPVLINVENHLPDINTTVQNIEAIQSVNANLSVIQLGIDVVNSEDMCTGEGQYYGTGIVKPISYVSNSTIANETITVVSDTNSFAIEEIVIESGSELIIEDGSVFKIL